MKYKNRLIIPTLVSTSLLASTVVANAQEVEENEQNTQQNIEEYSNYDSTSETDLDFIDLDLEETDEEDKEESDEEDADSEETDEEDTEDNNEEDPSLEIEEDAETVEESEEAVEEEQQEVPEEETESEEIPVEEIQIEENEADIIQEVEVQQEVALEEVTEEVEEIIEVTNEETEEATYELESETQEQELENQSEEAQTASLEENTDDIEVLEETLDEEITEEPALEPAENEVQAATASTLSTMAASQSITDINDYIAENEFEVAEIQYDIIEHLPHYAYNSKYGSEPENGQVGKPTGVVLHDVGNDTSTIHGEINYMSENWENAFVHAFVDANNIIQIANTDYLAYGAGPISNDMHLHVELVRHDNQHDFAKSINNYADYIANLLYKYKLPAERADNTGEGTLWSHVEVSHILGGTGSSDPYEFFQSHGYAYNDVIDLISNRYNDLYEKVKAPSIYMPTFEGETEVLQADVTAQNRGLYESITDVKTYDASFLQGQDLRVVRSEIYNYEEYYLLENANDGSTIGWMYAGDVVTSALEVEPEVPVETPEPEAPEEDNENPVETPEPEAPEEEDNSEIPEEAPEPDDPEEEDNENPVVTPEPDDPEEDNNENPVDTPEPETPEEDNNENPVETPEEDNNENPVETPEPDAPEEDDNETSEEAPEEDNNEAPVEAPEEDDTEVPADENTEAAAESVHSSLEDPETGVRVYSESDELEDKSLVVTMLGSSDAINASHDLFDIHVLDADGSLYNLNHPVTVYLPANGYVSNVYYLGNIGETLESVNYNIEDGYVVFGASSFSQYAVVYGNQGEENTTVPPIFEDKEIETEETSDNRANEHPKVYTENVDDSAATVSDSVEDSSHTEQTETKVLPNTGVAEQSTTIFAAILAALGLGFLVRRRKPTEK